MKRLTVDPTVRRETVYIAAWTVGLSVLMQLVFLCIGHWDLTVLFGNLLSAVLAIGNFFLMGLAVQKAVTQEEKQAAATVRMSQVLRMVLLFAVAAIGILLPACFSPWTVLIPLFFPRIALAFRAFFPSKDGEGGDGA